MSPFCLFRRTLLVLLFSSLSAANSRAQAGDPVAAAQVPVPGVGHHYIGIGVETVNPADGSLTFDLPIKTPPGRMLNFPFGIHYSSSEMSGLGTQGSWSPQSAPPDDLNGWTYGLPTYLATATVTGSAPGDPYNLNHPYFQGDPRWTDANELYTHGDFP